MISAFDTSQEIRESWGDIETVSMKVTKRRLPECQTIASPNRHCLAGSQSLAHKEGREGDGGTLSGEI